MANQAEQPNQSYLETAAKLLGGLTDKRLRTPGMKAKLSELIKTGELKLWEINDEILYLKFFGFDLLARAEQIPQKETLLSRAFTCERDGRSIRLTEENQQYKMYRLQNEPEALPDFNDYFLRAIAEGDSRYFCFFLHFYENILNKQVSFFCRLRRLPEECFPDLKQIFVATLWEAMLTYTADNPYPLLALAKPHVWREWDKYVARTCGALTITSESAYTRLCKVAAIYYRLQAEGHTESDCIAGVAQEMNITNEKSAELVAQTKIWRYADNICTGEVPEDGESVSGIVYEGDLPYNSSFEELDDICGEEKQETDAIIAGIRDALAVLSPTEKSLFTEITGVDFEKKTYCKPKTLSDIALKLGMADETAVDKKRKKIIEKLVIPMVQNGILDGVKCKKISPPEDYPSEKYLKYYSYQAGFDGEAGLIVIDMTAESPLFGYRVLKTAECDTMNRHAYAHRLMWAIDELFRKEHKLPSEKMLVWRFRHGAESGSVDELIAKWATVITNRYVSYICDGRSGNAGTGYRSFEFSYQPEHTGEKGSIRIRCSKTHLLSKTVAYPRLADEDTTDSHIYADRVIKQILHDAFKTAVDGPDLPEKLSGEIRWKDIRRI